MSQAPKKLPKRTRVLVKDILFQEKYRLTHTQVDIMAYIINAITWAIKVGSFLPITNKKFHEDLPQISEKTLEEALRVLKSMELIDVQMITVPKWDNARVRGIKILPKGLEYNSSYFKIDEKDIIENLKKELFIKEQEIKALQEQLEFSEIIEKENKILEEAKEDEDESSKYDNLGFKELIETVTKDFGTTSEPICNMVKGWNKKTEFYINGYNKLSVLTPSNEVIQLSNPIEINQFWKYLYRNKEQIGKVVDFNKRLDIEGLNKRYVGTHFAISNNVIVELHRIEKVENGLRIIIRSLEDKNYISSLSRNGEDIIFSYEELEDFLYGARIC